MSFVTEATKLAIKTSATTMVIGWIGPKKVLNSLLRNDAIIRSGCNSGELVRLRPLDADDRLELSRGPRSAVRVLLHLLFFELLARGPERAAYPDAEEPQNPSPLRLLPIDLSTDPDPRGVSEPRGCRSLRCSSYSDISLSVASP